MINQIFYNFFARDIQSYDVILFFTHIQETFETVGGIAQIAIVPILKACILFVIILFYKKSFLTVRFSAIVICIFVYIAPYVSGATSVIYEMIQALTYISQNQTSIQSTQKYLPTTINDNNIILIFGESLREDIFLQGKFYEEYSKKQNFYYNQAISLATNTDVVLPLFLNNTNDLNNLSLDKNLFRLAKQNGYSTYFYSTQYDQALKYIKPYLSLDSIDSYANGHKESFDQYLLDNIANIDFSKKSFLVLQMYGEHSPYKRYPPQYNINIPKSKKLDDTIVADYKNSFLYSEYILNKILYIIEKKTTKETIIIFVSDHAEMIYSEYGHNKFHKDIYTVPSFVYTINSSFEYKKKQTYQLELSNLILNFLGYENPIIVQKPYKVNGTMISGEDGYVFVP